MIQTAYNTISDYRILRILIVIAGIAGIGVALIFTNAYTIVIPISLLVGVLFAAFSDSAKSLKQRVQPQLVLVTLAIGFTISTFLYHNAGFQRTLEIHLLTAGLYALCALLSISTPKTALCSAFVVGLQQRAFIYYSSATQFGLDTLFHQRMAREILAAGSLTPLATAFSKYYHAPTYHILVSSSSSLTATSIRDVAFLTSSFLVVLVPALVLFSIGRRYWSTQAGALASILFILTDYAITWGVRPRPLALAIIFFAISFVMLIRHFEDSDNRFLLVAIGMFSILLLTHQFSSFTVWVAFSIIGFTYYGSRDYRTGSGFIIPILSGCLLTVSWMITMYRGPLGDSPSFLESLFGIAIQHLARSGQRTAIFPASEHYVVAGANTLDPVQIIGIGSMLALTVAGVISIRRQDLVKPTLPLVCLLLVGIMSGIALAGPMIGFSVLQPFRWFIFIYIPAAVLGGVYLSTLNIPRLDTNISPVVLLIGFIFIIAFFAGANFTAAPDGAPLDSPGAERLTVHDNEAAGLEFVRDRQGETVVFADYVAWQLAERHYGANAEVYRFDEYGGEIATNENHLALYREYSTTHHAGWYIRDEDGNRWRVYSSIPRPDGDQVYDNGGVWLISRG